MPSAPLGAVCSDRLARCSLLRRRIVLHALPPAGRQVDTARSPEQSVSRYLMTSRPATTPNDAPAAPTARRRLGAGRSGQVFEEVTPDGRRLACKVFLPDRASSLVNTVLMGAVNPYRWDKHAVACAVLRRRILEPLVRWWFDDKVRLPATDGARWFDESLAFELRAELIEGRHAMLRHPLAGEAKHEVDDLVNEVLRPLQQHLDESGFDGLLWQAGRGNPVAAANFMRDLTDTAAIEHGARRAIVEGWHPAGPHVVVPADVRSAGSTLVARVPAERFGGPLPARWCWRPPRRRARSQLRSGIPHPPAGSLCGCAWSFACSVFDSSRGPAGPTSSR